MPEAKEAWVEAINLQVRKFPTGRLLSVYSKEYGLLKLGGSRLGGRSEPFVHNLFLVHFSSREEIHRIRASEFQGYFKNLAENLALLWPAWQYAEFLQNCSHFREERSAEIFELLREALTQLDQIAPAADDAQQRSTAISLHFFWYLCTYLGYRPDFQHCYQSLDSAGGAEQSVYFDLQEGLLKRMSQREALLQGEQLVRIARGVGGQLKHLEQDHLERIRPETQAFLLKTLQNYLQRQAGCKIKSSATNFPFDSGS